MSMEDITPEISNNSVLRIFLQFSRHFGIVEKEILILLFTYIMYQKEVPQSF